MESLRIKKRYGLYWYKHTCRCGNTTYIPLLFLNIRFSFTNKIYKTCRKCGYISSIRNIGNTNTDTADKTLKKLNKDFKEPNMILKEIWRKG